MPVIGFMSKTAKNFMKNNCFNIIFNLCVSMQKKTIKMLAMLNCELWLLDLISLFDGRRV